MKKDIVDYLQAALELPREECTEYIDAFMASFDDCCAQLEDQYPDKIDFAQLRVITHTMIGFSENMGAMDLLAITKELNTAAKAGDIATCTVEIKKILELQQLYQTETI